MMVARYVAAIIVLCLGGLELVLTESDLVFKQQFIIKSALGGLSVPPLILFASGKNYFVTSSAGRINKVDVDVSSDVVSIDGISGFGQESIVTIEQRFNDGLVSDFMLWNLRSESKDRLWTIPYIGVSPSVSRDQKSIAFLGYDKSSNKYQIHVFDVNAGTGKAVVSVDVNDETQTPPSWTSGGQGLVYDGKGCQVQLLKLEAEEGEFLAEGDYAVLSPSGRQLLYRPKCRGNDFVLSDIRGKQKVELRLGKYLKGTVWSAPRWSEDGRYLGLYTYKETLLGRPRAFFYLYDIVQREMVSQIPVPTPNKAVFWFVSQAVGLVSEVP